MLGVNGRLAIILFWGGLAHGADYKALEKANLQIFCQHAIFALSENPTLFDIADPIR